MVPTSLRCALQCAGESGCCSSAQGWWSPEAKDQKLSVGFVFPKSLSFKAASLQRPMSPDAPSPTCQGMVANWGCVPWGKDHRLLQHGASVPMAPKKLCKEDELCMKRNKIYTPATVFTLACESPQSHTLIPGTYQDSSFLGMPVSTLKVRFAPQVAYLFPCQMGVCPVLEL